MKYRALPSQKHLRYHYYYSQQTGKLYRRFTSPDGRRLIGYSGIPFKESGYILTSVLGKQYRTHRLIWMYMTGEDPGELEIDHKDRNRSNNKWVGIYGLFTVPIMVNINKRYRDKK